MQSLLLFAVAVICFVGGKHLFPRDEIHALAAYVTGFLSILWGFSTASSSAQITCELATLSWLQVTNLRR